MRRLHSQKNKLVEAVTAGMMIKGHATVNDRPNHAKHDRVAAVDFLDFVELAAREGDSSCAKISTSVTPFEVDLLTKGCRFYST